VCDHLGYLQIAEMKICSDANRATTYKPKVCFHKAKLGSEKAEAFCTMAKVSFSTVSG